MDDESPRTERIFMSEYPKSNWENAREARDSVTRDKIAIVRVRYLTPASCKLDHCYREDQVFYFTAIQQANDRSSLLLLYDN